MSVNATVSFSGIPAVFSSTGGTATLPCDSMVSANCSSATWFYGSLQTNRNFVSRKIKPNADRADRLTLLSDCSFHIIDVTANDAGLYTCEQDWGEPGVPVYLTVLQGRFHNSSGGAILNISFRIMMILC